MLPPPAKWRTWTRRIPKYRLANALWKVFNASATASKTFMLKLSKRSNKKPNFRTTCASVQEPLRLEMQPILQPILLPMRLLAGRVNTGQGIARRPSKPTNLSVGMHSAPDSQYGSVLPAVMNHSIVSAADFVDPWSDRAFHLAFEINPFLSDTTGFPRLHFPHPNCGKSLKRTKKCVRFRDSITLVVGSGASISDADEITVPFDVSFTTSKCWAMQILDGRSHGYESRNGHSFDSVLQPALYSQTVQNHLLVNP